MIWISHFYSLCLALVTRLELAVFRETTECFIHLNYTRLVDCDAIELTTISGPDPIWTDDLYRARIALYQLSYGPLIFYHTPCDRKKSSRSLACFSTAGLLCAGFTQSIRFLSFISIPIFFLPLCKDRIDNHTWSTPTSFHVESHSTYSSRLRYYPLRPLFFLCDEGSIRVDIYLTRPQGNPMILTSLQRY